MRHRPINSTDPARQSVRVDPITRADAGVLARQMNRAPKPEGFPVTYNHRAKSVSMSAAIAASLALVRDMLDDGAITEADLLAHLKEIKPAQPEPWE